MSQMTKKKVEKNASSGSSGSFSVNVDWRFWLAAFVYVGTGILQPMIIDYLKGYNALGRKVLLLPTLANVMGMSLCGCLASKEEWANFSFQSNRRVIGMASMIDWISGMLCTGGILLTGGAIFVILYNSCPAWTALLSWFFLNQTLSSYQLLGIVLVILGLIANVWGTKATSSTSTSGGTTMVVIGSLVVLAGSFLHSAMFVVSDYALNMKTTTTTKISPTIWSCCLGTLESIAMILWVCGHVYHNGFNDATTTTTTTMESNTSLVVVGFIGLLFVDALHAVSFFSLLSSLGAIGSALLKGVQTIIVVILSGIFFCSVDTPQQCMTVSKGFSMFMILSGVFTFAFGKKNKKTKVKLSPSPSFSDTKTTNNIHPTEQTKSLLSKN